MSYSFLELHKEDRVITVRINRPEAKNALSVETMRELTRVAEGLRDDLETSMVILRGSDDIFSAGADLRDPEMARVIAEPLAVRRRLLELGSRMCAAWEGLPQVGIAALEGCCIGGAVSLAMACDFRVMASDAYLRIPEIDLGMNYSWGSLSRLVNLVGPATAKKWVLMAPRVEAAQAIRSGFAQWEAPPGGAWEMARGIAQELAEKPQAAVFMTKQTINALANAAHPIGHMDADQFALTLLSEDFQEGVSAFLEKRKPVFNKKLPRTLPNSPGRTKHE